VQLVANIDRCCYSLLRYQPLKPVGHENVPLFHIQCDESVLLLMMAFVRVSFSEFVHFLIILFLFVFYYFSLKLFNVKFSS